MPMRSTESQMNEIIVEISKVNNQVGKTIKNELSVAAKPVVSNLQANTPVGTRTHKRYSNGSVVATYSPGNLKKSIKVLRFAGSKSAVFVGPSVGKKKPNDGYYARFIQFGTKFIGENRFIERGLSTSLNESLKIMTSILKSKIDKI